MLKLIFTELQNFWHFKNHWATLATSQLSSPAAVPQGERREMTQPRTRWVDAQLSQNPVSLTSRPASSHRPSIAFLWELVCHQNTDGYFKAEYVFFLAPTNAFVMEPLKFFELLEIKLPAECDNVVHFKVNLCVLSGKLLSIFMWASDLLFLSYHPLDIPFLPKAVGTSTWGQATFVTRAFSCNSSM